MARMDDCQNRANFFLLFVCGMKLLRIFRRSARANPRQNFFVMRAASLAAQSVNAGANGDAIKPRLHIFMLRFLIAPQFQKNFDGQFFGAAAISDDALDDASDARIVRAKKRFNIERRGGGVHVGNGFARGVHNMHNAARKNFMTASIETLNCADCTDCFSVTNERKWRQVKDQAVGSGNARAVQVSVTC